MSKNRVVIIRTPSDEKQTLGNFFIIEPDGDILYQCKTLELAWKNNNKQVSCIPVGKYQVSKRWSEKYKNHFHITNVPNRDFILIHHGNYHTDILGCILVGISHADINNDGYKDVTSSMKTMEKLLSLLPNEFEIEII